MSVFHALKGNLDMSSASRACSGLSREREQWCFGVRAKMIQRTSGRKQALPDCWSSIWKQWRVQVGTYRASYQAAFLFLKPSPVDSGYCSIQGDVFSGIILKRKERLWQVALWTTLCKDYLLTFRLEWAPWVLSARQFLPPSLLSSCLSSPATHPLALLFLFWMLTEARSQHWVPWSWELNSESSKCS